MSAVISTCQNCVFARYDDDQVQTGCAAGRLEQFVRQGTPVRRAWESPPDWAGEGPPPRTGKEFCLVERACNMSRPHGSEWAAATPQEEWLAAARKEVATRFHVVAYAPEGTPVEAALATAGSALAQGAAVTVVLTGGQPRPWRLIPLMQEAFPGRDWNVRLVHERGPDGGPVTRGRAVDVVVNELRPSDAQFYLVVDAGAGVPPGLLAEVDAALNDRLERFLLLIGTDAHPGVGPLVQLRHHLRLGGNAEAERDAAHGQVVRCDTIEEKTSLLVPETGGLVRTVGEFCPPPA